MNNIPKVKIGIVAVSRDCFPESLSVNRRKALVDAYKAKYGEEKGKLRLNQIDLTKYYLCHPIKLIKKIISKIKGD